MKKKYSILAMFLLTGCAQDMGHYATLSAKGHCKIVTIAPNRNNIDNTIYKKLVEWAQQELPALGYLVLDQVTEDIPPACGEVVLHYSSQFLPNHDTPPMPTDTQMCANAPTTTPLSRYQLTLAIQHHKTKENVFIISTEMESSETDQEKILSDMESALYDKFLRVQGPESQVETKTTSKILPA
jgi:hypothetical protein